MICVKAGHEYLTSFWIVLYSMVLEDLWIIFFMIFVDISLIRYLDDMLIYSENPAIHNNQIWAGFQYLYDNNTVLNITEAA